jgi:Tol biopolymer transport system component
MSADGRFVAFTCHWTGYVRDRQTGSVVALGYVDTASSPAISGNGRHVAVLNEVDRIVVRDLVTGAIAYADVSSAGVDANDVRLGFYLLGPAISRYGRFVAFGSGASNLVPDDTNGMLDYFVHDRDVDGNGVFDEPGKTATERVSIGPAGEQLSIGGADTVGISDDGRFVVFAAVGQVFLRDRAAGTTIQVTRHGDGTPFTGGSSAPAISGDGRFVVLVSWLGNVVPLTSGDQVLVWDRMSGSFAIVSVDATGGLGNASVGYDSRPSISADGRYIAFPSAATNLVASDTNGVADVFVAPNPLYP